MQIRHTFGDAGARQHYSAGGFNKRHSEVFLPFECQAATEDELLKLIRERLNPNARLDEYKIRFIPNDNRMPDDQLDFVASDMDYQEELEDGPEETGEDMEFEENLDVYYSGPMTQYPPDSPLSLSQKELDSSLTKSSATVLKSKGIATSVASPPPQSGKVDIYEEYKLPRPASSPPFLYYMLIVNEVVAMGIKDDELIIEYDKVFKIRQRHLVCLIPVPERQNWLQDTVVDYYLALIAKRNSKNLERYAKIYKFRCTFYPILASRNGLKEVKDSAEGKNIFAHEIILFPVCQGDHWRLVSVDVQRETVTIFNSLNNRYSPTDASIVKNIVLYLNQEYGRVHPLANGSPKWIRQKANCPQQDNQDDCGVFTLLFADYLSRRKPFDFDCSHMTYFRAKIMYECISGRLLQ